MPESFKIKIQIWVNEDSVLEKELEASDGNPTDLRNGVLGHTVTIHNLVQKTTNQYYPKPE